MQHEKMAWRVGACLGLAALLNACGGGSGNSATTADTPTAGTSPAPPSPAASVASFTPQTVAWASTDLGGPCPTAAQANAAARIDRVWLAQTHLMETSWPFFFLLENRAALLKLDVSAPSGAAPTGRVTASWPDGSSETLCLRAPDSLPASTDMRPLPPAQDLARSYALALPARWMRPGLALSMALDGGASAQRSAAELKVASSPDLTLVVLPTLLFGDTQPRPLDDAPAEFGSKLPISTLRVATTPFNLALPRLVIAPRTDSPTADGSGTRSTPAQWADTRPHCSAADKAAGTCSPYSGFAVLDATLNLAAALQRANGMDRTALWYANHGLNSGVGGGLGGGNHGSGDNFGLVFNHEMGHAMGLPHLGDVTGTRQTSAQGLMHPYTGETQRSDGQPLGGGFGRTWALDPLDWGLVSPVCAATGQEQQDPMQRSCNTVRPGRRFDHFSDAAGFKLLRYFNGAAASSGSLPYYSRLLAGSSADAPQATRYQFPAEGGRTQLRVSGGGWALYRWSTTAGAYEQVLRPPAGDAGFLGTPPAAPAGQQYDQYYDFHYPQQFDVPVITVYGSFNASADATSTIYAAQATRGHLMRLWDPSQPGQLDAIKNSVSGETFWWGYDLHLRVHYRDGSVRMVAMPVQAKPTTDPMQGFATWAVNLPDDGRALDRIELLQRPLCSRNGAASDRSCDVNLAANGITAANVYDSARVAASWTAPR